MEIPIADSWSFLSKARLVLNYHTNPKNTTAYSCQQKEFKKTRNLRKNRSSESCGSPHIMTRADRGLSLCKVLELFKQLLYNTSSQSFQIDKWKHHTIITENVSYSTCIQLSIYDILVKFTSFWPPYWRATCSNLFITLPISTVSPIH